MADEDLSTRLQWPTDPFGSDDDGDDASAAPRRDEQAGTGRNMAPGGQLDLLIEATAALKAVLLDRLDAHDTSIDRLVRAQVGDLERYRQATERAVAEVRTAALATEESIRGMSASLDQINADVGRLAASVRLFAAQPALGAELAELRTEIAALRRRLSLRATSPAPSAADVEAIVEAVVARLEGTD